MAGDTRKLTVEIIVDDKGAVAEMKKIEGVGDQIGKKSGTWGKGFVVTLGDVQRIGGQVVDWARDFIAVAEESEAANIKLNEALRSQSNLTEENLRIAGEFAAQTQAQLGIDDESITLIQAKIAALTGLSGTALNDATKATMAYSEVMGVGEEMASKAIAKYLDGGKTLRGLTLDIDANATAQEKMTALMDKVGAGWAQLTEKGNTFEGNINKVSLAWEEAKERIGAYITKSDLVPKITDAIIDGLNWLISAMDGTNPAFNQMVEDVKGIIDAVSSFIGWIDRLNEKITLFSGAYQASMAMITGGTSLIGPAFDNAVDSRYGGASYPNYGPEPPSGYRGSSSVRIGNVDEIAAAVAGQTGMRLKEATVGG